MGRPIRSVLVAGNGVAAWLAAAVLVRRVPGLAVAVAESAGASACLEDVYAGTWPGFRSLLTQIGIDERVLVARGGGTMRLGQHRRGWGAGEFTACFGRYGVPIGGVPFHQLWARAAAEGEAAALQEHSTAAMLARAGRFTEPAAGVPGYEAGLNFDPVLLRDALRDFATAQGVRRIGLNGDPSGGSPSPFPLGSAERAPSLSQWEHRVNSAPRCSGHAGGMADPMLEGGAKRRKGEGEFKVIVAGGRIQRVHIGGTAIEADLYVDATGGEAGLLSALPGGGEVESWARWLPIDRALVADAPPDRALPVVDLAEAHPAGWRLIAPLASRTIAVHLFASGLSDAEAERAAFGVPGARAIAFAQGRRRRGWIGNCVSVGDAVAVIEPLGAPGLLLTAMTIERIVESLPDTDFADVELAEYNRRWAIDAELVRDFVIAQHATARRDDAFGRAIADLPPPEPLGHALALFGERGVLPARDGDPARLDDWLGVLIGNGVVPRKWSAAADAVPRERFAHASEGMRRAIGEAVARAPAHRAWLERWMASATAG